MMPFYELNLRAVEVQLEDFLEKATGITFFFYKMQTAHSSMRLHWACGEGDWLPASPGPHVTLMSPVVAPTSLRFLTSTK